MIIVRLMGGLGNQMFQYAAAQRLALVHGTNLKLDLGWLDKYQDKEAVAARRFALDCFNIKAAPASRWQLARVDTPPNNLKRQMARKFGGSLSVVRQAETGGFHPEILKLPDNVYLEGYWQSEDYFKDKSAAIRADLTFRKQLSAPAREIAESMEGSNSVSIHVRRGDYVTLKSASEVLGTLPPSYYQKAIARICKELKDPLFLVFSDDINWCKKNLKIDKAIYSEHGGGDWEDMKLMSDCKHHIIANSSFSWWGAWLGAGPSKMVIAPKQWFRAKQMNTSSLLPKEWIKL